MAKKILIIGGVAGGASCAARLRRNDETAEITVLERGSFVSFANCGLPYYAGGVIPDEAELILATPELFQRNFRIDVRSGNEALSIDRGKKTVRVRRVADGTEYDAPYDVLVLSPGANPLRPPLPGIDLPGIFSVRTIPDIRDIKAWIGSRSARRAVIVGAGFIGLEMAENLRHLGLEVTVVEMLAQIMPPMDPEMVKPAQDHLVANGITLALGDGVAGFDPVGDSIHVRTQSGKTHPADLVILSIGVRPEVSLAQSAGLELGARGGIRTDAQMRTSDPSIFAVGDAVEVVDILSGQPTLLALAGPANRQGRIVADAICGKPSKFRGVQGTSVCGLFDLAIGMTGASEKALRRAGRTDFRVAYLHPRHHVGYYPGASLIHLKLLYEEATGKVLGAQACGTNDVARKLDVIAMAIQMGGTVHDLAEAELCYAPQYGAAKDAVNFAGMIAGNDLSGEDPLVVWTGKSEPGTFLLDVREPDEFQEGHLEGAVNIPLGTLRGRLGEIPRDRPVHTYCRVGQRAHTAVRILRQNGIDARNLTGGWLLFGTAS